MSFKNDRRPSHKSGKRQENRKASYFPDLLPTIPDNWGCPRFRVFISWQNLGRSGNDEIPDCPGFSRHMKTSFEDFKLILSVFDGKKYDLG